MGEGDSRINWSFVYETLIKWHYEKCIKKLIKQFIDFLIQYFILKHSS